VITKNFISTLKMVETDSVRA